MDYHHSNVVKVLFLLSCMFIPLGFCEGQDIGSCAFEGLDWLCGYTQPTTDNFNWSHPYCNGSHCMRAYTSNRQQGSTAELITPKIQSKDTHCFTFQVFVNDSRELNVEDNSTMLSNFNSQLNIYVQDNKIGVQRQSVWNSNSLKRNVWNTIELALTPRAYQVVFEAAVLRLHTQPDFIDIDNIVVSSSACEAAPHFLRLGDKVVNVGQRESLQCLLWGRNISHTLVTLQKSNGDVLQSLSREEVEDHLRVSFTFSEASLSNNGSYRCLSDSTHQVGVSNYARLSVKVPPTPKRGPKVIAAGATHLKIELNAGNYVGDGPIVSTNLVYRPVNGSWSDVHEIASRQYDLWHLQPDTQYELAVTLSRPGVGGAGHPGPFLRKKTKCGVPKSSVRNMKLKPVGTDNPAKILVAWDAPDFSITQCHNYEFIVKYREYSSESAAIERYKSERVKKTNSVEINGLKPFNKYMFKVELINAADEGSKETGLYTVQTSEAVPGPVPRNSFIVTESNQTSITVQWREPTHPNGNIIKYEVSHIGNSTSDPVFVPENDQGLFELKGTDRQLDLAPLHPGTTYRISICAKTSVGCGRKIVITGRTSIAPPTLPQYPPINPNTTSNATTTTPTTIEIIIKRAIANGAPITGYYVIVADQTPPVTPPTKRKKNSSSRRGKGRKKKAKNRGQRSLPFTWLSRLKRMDTGLSEEVDPCRSPPITYQESLERNLPYYASAMFLPDDLKQDTKVVVGDNGSSSGFSNPPLDPNKEYKIFIRVESETDGEKSISCQLVAIKTSAPTTTSPTTTSPPTLPPDHSDLVDGNLDGGRDNSGNANGNSTNPLGEKQPAEQKEVLMYAGVGVASAVILIIIIIIIIFLMKKKRGKEEVDNPFEVRMMMSDLQSPAHTLLPIGQSQNDNSDRQALMPDVVGCEHPDFLDKSSDGGTTRGYVASSNDERFAVRVDDFHVHVSQMKASDGYGFRDEYSSFPDRPTAPWAAARSTLNQKKNRYMNIMAYDHSRVVLDPPEGHEEEFESDYINASYMNGYKKPSMYIATQAPTSDTINDFWWMVWQEKTTVIVMLTNLVELARVKCEKYWPDDRASYGAVEVSLNKQEELCDYTVRTFVLQQEGGYDVREVKQFHFTAWPDHGVPSRPTNLLTFIRKIKAYEPQGQGPTIVHCSAGAGRTGCFMVIDMMLDMAKDEDIVDVYNTVKDLRSRRINTVQTEEQYVFIHEAVLEAILCGDTLVDASELIQHYDELITVDPQTHFAPIQEEFDTLNVITPKLSDEECSVARLPRNRNKNRFMDVLPADRHLAYLVTTDPNDRDSNYINAVYLDSYSRKDSFLVTHMPLTNTVMDIWRLIYDHKCTSVVMMNDVSEHDQTCAQYWPDRGSIIIGPFTVELLSQEDEVDVICRLFKLQNVTQPTEPFRLVRQFQVINWPAAQPVPYSRNSVLRVIQLVMNWQSHWEKTGDRGRTLVHCVAGAGRSGTFLSCYNMCEQLRHEFKVDIFNIVLRLRNVRPQLVETLEQYRFCYEVGIEFAAR